MNAAANANNLPTAATPSTPQATTNDAVASITMSKQPIAPIAREEDDEAEDADNNEDIEDQPDWLIDNNAKEANGEDAEASADSKALAEKGAEECHQPQSSERVHPIDLLLINEENIVRRSKSSRVRNYLRKCKDRWLAVGSGGHNNANAEQHNAATTSTSTTTNMEHDPKTTTLSAALNESNVSDQERCGANLVTEVSSAGAPSSLTVNEGSRHHQPQHQRRYTNCALGSVEEMEDDDVDVDADANSYEDIDFGLAEGYDAIDTTTPRQSDKQPSPPSSSLSLSSSTARTRTTNKSAQNQRQDKSQQLAHRLGDGHDNDNGNDNDDRRPNDGSTVRDLNGNNENQLVDSSHVVSLICILESNDEIHSGLSEFVAWL